MRIRRPLAAAALAALLLLPAPVALAAPAPVPKAATRVSGWADAPASVRAGKPFLVAVRAIGAKRVVALQRRTEGRWHRVALAVEGTGGIVHLRWTPTASGRAVLRVHVRPSRTREATSTERRAIVVQPARTATPSPAASADPQLDRVLVLVNAARAAGATCGGSIFRTVMPLTRSSAARRHRAGVREAHGDRGLLRPHGARRLDAAVSRCSRRTALARGEHRRRVQRRGLRGRRLAPQRGPLPESDGRVLHPGRPRPRRQHDGALRHLLGSGLHGLISDETSVGRFGTPAGPRGVPRTGAALRTVTGP